MIVKSGAKGADNFLTIENGQFLPPPNTKQMEDFSEPPRRTDSKNPIFFFFFCRISGLGHLQGLGVSLGRILGGGVN